MTSLYDFKDYRDFLQEWIAEQPRRGRGQQLRMAEAAQVQATFISQVISKKCHLSVEQAYSVAQYLRLAEKETDFLQLLVQYERAGKNEYREFLREKIEKLRAEAKAISSHLRPERTPSDLDLHKYFSSWIHPAVHLLCLIPEFSSPAAIATRLSLSSEKVHEALRFLMEAGLLTKQDNRYHATAMRLHAPKHSPQLMSYQLTSRARATQKIAEGGEDVHFTSIHSVSRTDFERIRSEILQLIQRADLISGESEADDVFGFNIDYFRI